MNRKIFAIFVLLIVAASINAVSAFDLGDIFGAGENENVTIGGIDFNIPAGYEEDTSGYTINAIDLLKNQGYKVTGKAYSRDFTKVGLFVLNYSDFEIDDEEILSTIGGNATTIKGINGLMNYDNGTYLFSYTSDYCMIIVSSTDENTIEEFLIA